MSNGYLSLPRYSTSVPQPFARYISCQRFGCYQFGVSDESYQR